MQIIFDIRPTRAVLQNLLAVLCSADVEYLRSNPQVSIYSSGVRYRRETGEHWKDVVACVRDGHGDCEDLAAWRAAELRIAGHDAVPVLIPIGVAGNAYHAVVKIGDTTEDPSALLGMR